MDESYIKNKKLWIPERPYGVCVWILPDENVLVDADVNPLCVEGFVNDRGLENKLREAVKYWTGSEDGRPSWIQGARKVSTSEQEDQKERLALGLVPDPYEDVIDTFRRSK